MKKAANNNSHPFLWLHIKKCGGQSFRESFTPPYVQTDRLKNPKPFIATPKCEWNDVLNNYRIPLGEYDNKRMLFAKQFLYTEDEFANMFKFVIVRNPFDRAASVWKYLFRPVQYNPKHIKMKNSFEAFLSELPNLWSKKYDRHIYTHSLPIWPDITDKDGVLLVDSIFKLENMHIDLMEINRKLGASVKELAHINRTKEKYEYRSYYSDKSIEMVERLYKDDIEKLNYSF